MKLIFAGLLFAAAALPASAAEGKKPILLVLTNHGDLGDTGKPTGFFLSEAAHPWKVFRSAGYPVEIASPVGGWAPLDPKSFDLGDPVNAAFWKEFGGEASGRRGVKGTLSLSKVDPSAYAAIFFAGGHGAMWDFPDSASVRSVTTSIYEGGGAVGAVCHGPAALVGVKLSGGNPLVGGTKVASFTDNEEKAVGLVEVVPFLLESRLRSLGAKPVPAENFAENAVLDGRLATGQNPASATRTANLLLRALAGS